MTNDVSVSILDYHLKPCKLRRFNGCRNTLTPLSHSAKRNPNICVACLHKIQAAINAEVSRLTRLQNLSKEACGIGLWEGKAGRFTVWLEE